MSGSFPVTRKNMQFLLKEAEHVGSYAEFPLLQPGVDPQICLSRSDGDQPFHLICEKDCVIGQLRGAAAVEFQGASVNRFALAPGDFVYVPAGTPHRIVDARDAIQLRYKAAAAGRESVVWYCDDCGTELTHRVWDTTQELPQEAYLAACEAFNAAADLRRCRSCGAEHGPIDTAQFRWREIAAALRQDEANCEATPV